MSIRRIRQRNDRGATAVLFGVLLSAMVTVCAFGTDIGRAYAERRHDQNTVDAAAMSGLVEGVLGGGVVNDIVAEVEDKAETTLDREIAPEEWEACVDDQQLDFTTRELQSGNPTISPVTDCISFSVAFDEIRVKLPDQKVPGIFSPIVGIDALTVNASANAEIVNGAGSGAPPFVALATATQGDFVCLRTSSNPEPIPLANGNGPGTPATFPLAGDADARYDPCDSSQYPTDSENFGTLLPWRYLDGCTQVGNDPTELAVSIGIDHTMGFFDGGYLGPTDPRIRVDGGAGCTVAFPNTFEVDSGFNAQGLRCALLSKSNSTDCNGVDPRLKQGDYVQSTYKFVGESMDNQPPWYYLRPAQDLWDEGAPKDCVAVAASRSTDNFHLDTDFYPGMDHEDMHDNDWEHHDRFDALLDCLEEWVPPNDPTAPVDPTAPEPDPELFVEEIGANPRFAFIPQIHEDNLYKVDYVHIEGFLPVYMYRMYTSKNDVMCEPADPRSTNLQIHDAGQEYSCGADNANVDRLASIIFACGMVPDTLCNKDTGVPRQAGEDIYEYRLKK